MTHRGDDAEEDVEYEDTESEEGHCSERDIVHVRHVEAQPRPVGEHHLTGTLGVLRVLGVVVFLRGGLTVRRCLGPLTGPRLGLLLLLDSTPHPRLGALLKVLILRLLIFHHLQLQEMSYRGQIKVTQKSH